MVDSEVRSSSVPMSNPVPEIVLDDDEEEMDTSEIRNGTASPQVGANQSNGTPLPKENGTCNGSDNGKSANGSKSVDCIELDDDEDETPAKKAKTEEDNKDVKKEPELTSYTALLDKLEVYIKEAFEKNDNVDRKLLDALLAAINIQVQKEPYSVRKLILDKQLVLPNTISFPPSQVVDMIIEHDAEAQLSRVIAKLFGDEKIKFTETEKRERQNLKANYAAPSMTKMLLDIGQDLVQESTYSDIVHARNLPEVPKNVDTYKQVAAQLKPVWESLRDKNQAFKLHLYSCSVCDFKTDSLIVMSVHKQTLHLKDNKRIYCGMCPEYNTNGNRMERHMVEVHALKPLMPEEPPSKIQCPICEENFQFKGQRDGHLKTCKRDYAKVNKTQASHPIDSLSTINRWLWPKPQSDPTIAAQQHDIQKQQMIKQQQQQQRFAAAAAVRQAQAAAAAASPATLKATQQLLATQQLASQIKGLGVHQQQQLNQILRDNKASLPPAVLQAVQAQLQKIQAQQTVGGIPGFPNLNAQQIQQLQRSLSQQRRGNSNSTMASASKATTAKKSTPLSIPSGARAGTTSKAEEHSCEICDDKFRARADYLSHLKTAHNTFKNRNTVDLDSGPPLACSRCRDRFWSYDGLERHLVMNHNLVTSDLLVKAQNKLDSGRCKHCLKTFAFNILQHLAADHNAKLCSAEIMFSCDVCPFRCSSYQSLEVHLNQEHPKNGKAR
ncbi:unnamed protein product [Bursaphelenchus xylophilus]|uniref:(pine wood nematode) hypothetical protein n=1 Tax=Bursaphelenchus xylophilus TaxID=6326 RepID=A0A1I7RH92_BURXY|nr:unnamed protein product [Bursaphelenchus xylophilus]CAG9115922.1 unnamed protein product [Bursaphelenchus xylophilus]